MKQPRLRDSRDLAAELYPMGKVPAEIICKIGASVIYLLHTGRTDLGGDDWGRIFAAAVDGKHLGKPVGIADVVRERMAWSMKTVKKPRPFEVSNVRLISGRCSTDYSYGIEDPHKDIQKTGDAVLSIWNSRVDITLGQYPQARVCVLVRSNDMSQFALFEEYLTHYNIADFVWQESKTGTFEGIDKRSGEKRFVWQPHGSQFTIVTAVPDSAIKFKLRKPPLIQQDTALKSIGFDNTWVEIM